MKYKRLLLLFTSFIFLTAVIISSLFIFKIAEISIIATQIQSSNENILTKTESELEKYKDKNIIFISKKSIVEEIKGLSNYIKVLDVKKSYPNKLIVKIEERREVFAIKTEKGFYMVDGEFSVLRFSEANLNNIDLLKNVELIVNIADYESSLLSEGNTFKFNDLNINNTMLSIIEFVKARRENINSITVNVRSDGMLNRFLVFKMIEGVEIQIDKADEFTNEKLNALFNYYEALDNKSYTQKKYVTRLATGEIKVI